MTPTPGRTYSLMELFDMLDLLNQKVDSLLSQGQPQVTEPSTEKPKDFLSRSEAMDFLKISSTTLHKLTKAGVLKKYKIPNARSVYYKHKELAAARQQCKTLPG